MKTSEKKAKGVVLTSQYVSDVFADISSYFKESREPVLEVKEDDTFTIILEEGTVLMNVRVSRKGGVL